MEVEVGPSLLNSIFRNRLIISFLRVELCCYLINDVAISGGIEVMIYIVYSSTRVNYQL